MYIIFCNSTEFRVFVTKWAVCSENLVFELHGLLYDLQNCILGHAQHHTHLNEICTHFGICRHSYDLLCCSHFRNEDMQI